MVLFYPNKYTWNQIEINIIVFCDAMHFNLVDEYRRFRRTCCFRLQVFMLKNSC
jgi:hypothetical protein